MLSEIVHAPFISSGVRFYSFTGIKHIGFLLKIVDRPNFYDVYYGCSTRKAHVKMSQNSFSVSIPHQGSKVVITFPMKSRQDL